MEYTARMRFMSVLAKPGCTTSWNLSFVPASFPPPSYNHFLSLSYNSLAVLLDVTGWKLALNPPQFCCLSLDLFLVLCVPALPVLCAGLCPFYPSHHSPGQQWLSMFPFSSLALFYLVSLMLIEHTVSGAMEGSDTRPWLSPCWSWLGLRHRKVFWHWGGWDHSWWHGSWVSWRTFHHWARLWFSWAV